MENDYLGRAPTELDLRDAIHIAIAPMRAAGPLVPGQHVGIIADGIVGESATPVGIVDPFLRAPVANDALVWVLLYPGTVRTLRHEWTHDAFVPGVNQAKAAAQIWMDKYADKMGVGWRDLIMHAQNYLRRDDYWTEGGRFEGEWVPDEFWPHYEALTGETVADGKRGSFLSCSC